MTRSARPWVSRAVRSTCRSRSAARCSRWRASSHGAEGLALLGVEPLLVAAEVAAGGLGAELRGLLLAADLEVVGDLGGLLGPAHAGAGELALEPEVLQVLRLLLGGPLELELRAGLDRLVVHLLEPLGGAVARGRRPC